METEENQQARLRMVSQQLEYRGIVDRGVLEAMGSIPRHRFVDPGLVSQAYHDTPLPIGHSQTISQPYIVALMTQLLQLQPDNTVLEIGTGSGYQAAVLSALAAQIYSVERIPELADSARKVLAEIGADNVQVILGDGSIGLEKYAPYDTIIVTAAAPGVPEPLKSQLAEGGRLVIPAGGRGTQYLERWTREGDRFHLERMVPVAFVPLLGEFGWPSA
ncbi:MAG: protein-L-isoaspartate(D-aspartate) O-methyltransferase [Anaerolineales bacterium]|nr:protein-L-isoaspartate(D-aspartate) O-methyltransferase [Anaerolineales bacterium]